MGWKARPRPAAVGLGYGLGFARNDMLIDTHAHLDYPDFAPDFDDVLKRAHDAGVTRIITIGTSIESSRRAVELAERHSTPGEFPNHRSDRRSAEDSARSVLR